MLYPSSLSLPLVPLSLPVPLSLAAVAGRGLFAGEDPGNTRLVFLAVCSDASRWKLSCEAICMIIE